MDAFALFLLAVIGVILWLISLRLKKNKRIGVAVAGQFLEIAGCACAGAGLVLLAVRQLFLLF